MLPLLVWSANPFMENPMKPLVYGYLRICGDESDQDLQRLEQQIGDFAEAKGYCFATIFYETDNGRQAAFGELIEALKRTETRDVIVPSMDHISAHPALLCLMLTRLATEANAHVYALASHPGQPGG
jgi:DNA invertase Pin-like site-specific DNA recombinase